jgi:hypothetical protein
VQLGTQIAREHRDVGSNLALAHEAAAVSSQALVRFSELIAEARQSSSLKFRNTVFSGG